MRDPNLPIGSRVCRCRTCGLYFNSPRSFERHRVGEVGSPGRHCLTEEELRGQGWGARGRGPYWMYAPEGKVARRPSTARQAG